MADAGALPFTGILRILLWTKLSVEAYPDIADVTSQVVTQVPGLAAEEVEQQITIPLERSLNGLPGMHVMRSKSTFGLSIITMVFRRRCGRLLGKTANPGTIIRSQSSLRGPTGTRSAHLSYRGSLQIHYRKQ